MTLLSAALTETLDSVTGLEMLKRKGFTCRIAALNLHYYVLISRYRYFLALENKDEAQASLRVLVGAIDLHLPACRKLVDEWERDFTAYANNISYLGARCVKWSKRRNDEGRGPRGLGEIQLVGFDPSDSICTAYAAIWLDNGVEKYFREFDGGEQRESQDYGWQWFEGIKSQRANQLAAFQKEIAACSRMIFHDWEKLREDVKPLAGTILTIAPA